MVSEVIAEEYHRSDIRTCLVLAFHNLARKSCCKHIPELAITGRQVAIQDDLCGPPVWSGSPGSSKEPHLEHTREASVMVEALILRLRQELKGNLGYMASPCQRKEPAKKSDRLWNGHSSDSSRT